MTLAGSREPLLPVAFEPPARDLHFALGAAHHDRDHLPALVGDPDVLVTASLRAGFDLLLSALAFARGDEVLFTPNIGAMADIARAHGLVPVFVELDLGTLAPCLASMARAITPRSRMIVVAHLFGARIDTGAAVRLAHEHGLLVVEDRAQAFHAPQDQGHPDADVVLHSFGILKTTSALGGALVRVRDRTLRGALVRLHDRWPLQSASRYARLALAHLAVRAFATRDTHAAALRAAALAGADLDALALRALCNHAPRRERPCGTLLAMIARRLEGFDASSLEARCAAVTRVAERLPRGVLRVGHAVPPEAHAHWVLPVLVPRPDALVDALRHAGLHATRKVVVIPHARFEGIVFLPFASGVEEHELGLLRALIEGHFEGLARPRRAESVTADFSQEIARAGGP